jgi:hypothetical protein
MLRNRIAETSTAPGTATTINLAGALTNRKTFASQFTTGALVYYVMDDGSQVETGYGTFTSGAPNTLSRTVVLWNSVVGRSSPTRLNFTGTTTVFCAVPAEKTILADQNDLTTLPGGLTVPGVSTLAGGGSFAASYAANGYQKLPGGLIFQWARATTGGGGTVVATFPIVFPTQCFLVVPSVANASAGSTFSAHSISSNAATTALYGLVNGALTSGVIIDYIAVGN